MTKSTSAVRSKGTILAADDDIQICQFLKSKLESEGFTVFTTMTLDGCRTILKEEEIDIVLLDVQFPEGNSIDILEDIVVSDSQRHIIMLTAATSVDYAVEAMKRGAYDYIQKPFKFEKLLISLEHAINQINLTKEVTQLRKNLASKDRFAKIIGKSKPMLELFDVLDQLSGLSVTVLLQAESGTGKELVARAIHDKGKRKRKPFVVVDCAAIPENLIESELFGHNKGAFTGADSKRIGKFERADGGTIFLDEIGEMPLNAQTRLLRVIQEREFERVGSDETIKIDVRIIVATNKDLKKLVKQKLFREDLYYRVSVFPLNIPPLRDRKEDIPLLSAHFINKYKDESKNEITGIDSIGIKILSEFEWPGNVRELENIIHRAVIVSQTDKLTEIDFPKELNKKEFRENDIQKIKGYPIDIKKFDEMEKDIITNALLELNGDINKAAKELGLGRATLYRKVKKYSIKYRS